ncbi:hypothetical protein BH10BDE1_BH10BDE1_07950 [soil metagenome]
MKNHRQQVISFLFLVAALFSPAAHGEASSAFICGANNVFLASEDMVVNLLDSIAMTRPRAAGEKPRFPKRGQCGLPGENWRVCTACTSAKDTPGYDKVLPFLADEGHRNWHAVWHKIRREMKGDGVNSFDAEKSVMQTWQREGWIPEDIDAFVTQHRIGGPLAGEDFFYMHRQMIKMLQIEMANVGAACISPWLELPSSALDAKWPVPRAVTARKPEYVKDEQQLLDEIIEVGQELRRPEYLRQITLSELGNAIEAKIHGKLHLLYASPISGCKNPETDLSVKCDELTHDRSAHLNQHFWKLHGFVDQAIGDWLKANGKDTIAVDCSQTEIPSRCYQWKGLWLGRLPKPMK